MIRSIAGRQNHSVKLALKLQKKKYRREHGSLVAEGLDLLRIAFDAGVEIADVLVRVDLVEKLPAGLRERAEAGALDIGVCDEETLAYASSLGGAADVIFIAREPQHSLADLRLAGSLTLFLDGIGDPGNVGTLVRSAVAFGADGVIASPGTADAFGPKALRAGMGAQFLTTVVADVTAEDLEARLTREAERSRDIPLIVVADSNEGEDVRSIASPAATILVLTAERPPQDRATAVDPGPDKALPAGRVRDNAAAADLAPERGPWPGAVRVRITQARFDSLNVAMAGTVLLYELARTRRGNCESPSLG
jgi:RNA methyltransferase, TrmH family